ncbi:TPA: DNA topoisomerase III [Vibrio parahaemolyticus]|uniref:DNA topoisomerase III n=1 Tax=Vibrio diabolicus TaxID=50719 RepID=UPI001DDBB5E3|nr:DNA topoisomerase III [Vibrio diabolicus]EGQ9696256.1 DNA topoisomerase III [Vibrio parahaemolyticus]EJX1342455.1 DNA topoisomerase III [Vibrio parahaemolyticus]
MRLFIAEKPSVAKAIAAELGVTGKGDGFIECGKDRITWCFGHMLEQAGPDEYTPDDVPTNDKGRKIWRIEELPIIPKQWILRPKDDAKKQVKTIGKLIKSATQIVNAGDPDREGQLLVDELLDHFNNTAPVVRYWSNAVDSVSVKRALANMKDNREFHGFAHAAEGRGKADWLIGMNLSRAYTLRAQRGGSRALLTVGRVQTPTLALVVNRDRDIESFKSIPFHTIRAEIKHESGSFWAGWKAKEDQPGLDDEGRLIDTKIADELVASLRGQPGTITDYIQEAKKQSHPLTFSLSAMTALASKKFGYSAQDVLDTCQSLYEKHKLTTYPRTDCAYLPESQLEDAPAVLAAVKSVNPHLSSIIDGADTGIKSRTWNDKKVSAHHGIIPTMHKGNLNQLNDKERNIYDLVVRTYLAQFYPVHEFLSTTVLVDVQGETFGAKGKVVTFGGWHDVYLDESEDDENDQDGDDQSLPKMKKGDSIGCEQSVRRDAKTKPPARFTEGTLITAMVNIHKFVTDPQHKKLLREGDGIGTEATRASIISELKRRNYLEAQGKKIVSTPLGRSMIGALPEVVKSPVLTALYERMLQSVESGNTELNAFIAKQEAFIKDQVAKANNGAVAIVGGKEAAVISDVFKCMSCGAGLSRRPLPKKKGHYWWGCSNFPTCKQTYPDLKGQPNYNKGRNK